MPRPEGGGWRVPVLALAVAVTAARLVLLAFDRTDLFVDEAQYWLWGQEPAFGYYSKPPLIAWVIRAVTDLAGSDAPFWVRMPGAVLHAVTAVLAAAVAARLWGGRVAVVAAAVWLTLPMVAVGSLLFSTDTVMLPCLAAMLLAWLRVLEAGRLRDAALAGLFLGLAVLAKYAGVYGAAGLAAAALAVPGWRVRAGCWAVLLGVAALVVAPNLGWNLTHGMATFAHTADNAGWLRGGARADAGALMRFWVEQFAVAGPVVAGAFLAALARPGGAAAKALAAMALVPLAVVSGQALLGGANANWAAAAWLPGSIAAAAVLAARPWLLAAGLAVNAAVALALPLATLAPGLGPEGRPLLVRYLGRADLSAQILAAAAARGLPVVAARRDVLADLFYSGRESGVAIHAVPPEGRPRHYYEQLHALPGEVAGDVLLVARDAGDCPVSWQAPLAVEGGAYAGAGLALWQVPADCLRAGRPGVR